jgi:hypothetical protein
MQHERQNHHALPALTAGVLNDLLVAAAWDGNRLITEVLLFHGADARHASGYPLVRAAENGHTAIVEMLIRHGAPVNEFDGYAIRQSARYGHLATVNVLIRAGADVAVLNNEAVRLAAAGDHHKVVHALLSAGARLHHPVPSPSGGERGPHHDGLSPAMAEVLRAFGDKGWDPQSPVPPAPVFRR